MTFSNVIFTDLEQIVVGWNASGSDVHEMVTQNSNCFYGMCDHFVEFKTQWLNPSLGNPVKC